ncbi:MAG: hypothetical protein NTW87_32475 [Planctomycetota bacterium]|nr:hypothetical protein [Planctomycetota bacterium]
MVGFIMIQLFSLVVSACIYGLYALFCNWIFRLLLRPLAVPESFAAERKRERLMTFLVFLALPMTWLGVLLLLGTYAVGAYRHLQERRAFEAGKPVPALPRIPRIALSELLVMVFSVALFPLLVSAIIEGFAGPFARGTNDLEMVKAVARVTALVIGILIFPLCFVSAYHRLEANRVALGTTRMLFLFVYPYMTFAMHVLIAGPFIALAVWAVMTMLHQVRGGGNFQHDVWYNEGVMCAAALVVMAAGIVLARRAKREAAASAAPSAGVAVVDWSTGGTAEQASSGSPLDG